MMQQSFGHPHGRLMTIRMAILSGAALGCVAAAAGNDDAAGVLQRRPLHRQQRLLVSSVAQSDRQYLAFPALLVGADELLVSYKRGRAHAHDPEASLEMVRIDPATGRASAPQTLAQLENHIMQMGEWVRFPNGDIASYIDVQVNGQGTSRTGLHFVRSTDGGRTFGPVDRVGVVEGVEYGYAFSAVVQDQTTWLLVMTFSNLTGGRTVYPPQPHAGAVHVIRSDDNGHSWRFVRDLSHEFGEVPINESTFLRHGDGYLLSTRGYDDRQRLHLTDSAFRINRQVDLTGTYSFITSHLGRPRLFQRDGRVYLLGRNWTRSPRTMQLGLFRIDPDMLTLSAWSILDNVAPRDVYDGYYAMPYFRDVDGQTMLHIVTYKAIRPHPPDIIQLDYRWDEVK